MVCRWRQVLSGRYAYGFVRIISETDSFLGQITSFDDFDCIAFFLFMYW